MILLYATTNTPRLQYSIYLLQQLMDCSIIITHQPGDIESHAGIAINYSHQHIPHCFAIVPAGLLFENNVQAQPENYSTVNKLPVLFTNSNSHCGFDILAASFYLASRYEEYLPHLQDSYGRYAHQNSAAWRYGFLQRAILHEWAAYFGQQLQQFYGQPLPTNNSTVPAVFLPTYDVDMAWSYLHKGWWRNLGGWLKNPSLERWQVLAGQKKDPFDSFAWISQLQQQYALAPIYFFLVANKNSQYDKNILPGKPAMQQLIQHISASNSIGLHPSWQSGKDGHLLPVEKQTLENIAGQSIWRSRQHYIQFGLPTTFRKLLDAGITADYSMGYGGINGFRASLAIPYFWFDVLANQTTTLLLHPFCFMDANSFFQQKHSVKKVQEDMLYFILYCKAWRGTCITIVHNHFLGSNGQWNGWRDGYAEGVANALGL
jgi:hypothetical protein